jgi:hypothetical protein
MRSRFLASLLACAVVLAGALAGSADARRKPTGSESAGIRAAVVRLTERQGTAVYGARTKRVVVSTVDPSYAMATLDAGLPVAARAILERRGSGWTVVSFGVSGFPFHGVPVRVLNDLLGATLCHCY